MTEALPFLHGLLEQSLTLSAVVLLLALLRPLLLRLGPAALYSAWLALPAALLASCFPGPDGAPLTQGLQTLRLQMQPLAQALPASLAGLPTPAGMDAMPGLAWIASMLWLLGALSLFAGLSRRYRLQRRQWLWDAATPCWRGPSGSSPALVGVWRTALLLPLDFEQRFSSDEQALILAHERQHQRRRDPLCNALALLLCGLHWFNPLLWWGLGRLRRDQELACDAAVLRKSPSQKAPSPARYAQALLKAQSLTLAAHFPATAWRPRHPLTERLSMLHHASNKSPLRRRLGLAAGFCVGLMCMSLASAMQAASAPKPGGEPPLQKGYSQVVTDVDVLIDGKPVRALTLTQMLATRHSFGIDKDRDCKQLAECWLINLTPTQAGKGQLKIQLDLQHGRRSESDDRTVLTSEQHPTLLVHENETAAIELKDEKGQTLRLNLKSHYILSQDTFIVHPFVERPLPL